MKKASFSKRGTGKSVVVVEETGIMNALLRSARHPVALETYLLLLLVDCEAMVWYVRPRVKARAYKKYTHHRE